MSRAPHAPGRLRRSRWAGAPWALLVLVALPTGAGAQPALGSLERATLARPETPVIVPGVRLDRLLGAPRDELRVYAWRDGALTPIPFQVDERTPEERYAFDKGDERRSDTDDGRLDINDELVFMARDVGDRVAPEAVDLGQRALEEVLVTDPRGGGQGWVYVLRFPTAPPPPSPRRYVRLEWRDGELAGWSGDRAQVLGPQIDENVFYFQQLRFAGADGAYGADVLDRAKISLEASYLFLDLRRKADEIRAEILGYTEGPVRIVASFQLETYLIWGHWVRSTHRCRMKIYGNRLEIEAELTLPVDLEPSRKSALRFSLDHAPGVGDVTVWTPKGEAVVANGRGGKEARRLERALPPWVMLSSGEGSVLARLRLSNDLQRPTNALFLEDGRASDPPEDHPGSHGNAGFALDLTELAAGTYDLTLVLQFGPPLAPGQEQRLLRVDDAPLQTIVTRE